MDALETIGLKQYDRNQMYRDYYLMAMVSYLLWRWQMLSLS